MNSKLPCRALAALSLAGSLLLAACGGSQEPAARSAPPETAPRVVSPSQGNDLPNGVSAAAMQPGYGQPQSPAAIEKMAQRLRTQFSGRAAQDPESLMGDVNRTAVPKAAPSPQVVYRFFNTLTGVHFYTISAQERDRVLAELPQFSLDGPAFFSLRANSAGLSPVYRFYNRVSGTHFYTISAAERDDVVARFPDIFQLEGVAWYASTASGTGWVPMHRFFNTRTGTHFYTASEQERANVVASLPDYVYEGIGYFIRGSGDPISAATFTVGGTVSGLGNGKSLVLRNNGGNDLTVSANGSFTFAGALTSGSAYAVTVLTQPTGQTCTVSSGSGTVSANVGNVAVLCTVDEPAGLGWTLTTANTGLAGVGLTCAGLPLYTGTNKPAAGTTISQVRITHAELILSNGNITLDRVCVQPTSVSNRMGVVFGYNPDTGSHQLGDVTILDSDIDGSLVTNASVYSACGFRGAGSVYRTKIWGLGNGICYFGSPTVSSSVVAGNYVFGLRGGMYGTPPQQSHNESGTIRSFTGTSLVWRNNKLVSHTGSDSGALFMQTISGDIRNVLIEGNYFETAAWNLALEAAYGNTYSAMQAINNRFVIPPGGFGAAYVTGGPGWAVWSDNFRYDAAATDGRGLPVARP